jgi:UDP-N-acetyl-D-glucosamine dehydrogenase
VLGAAYKPNVDDMRESPSLDVMHLLKQKSAIVSYHDPFIPQLELDNEQMISVPDLNQALQQADCVVILTNHSVYNGAEILENSRLIVDTRNALGDAGKNNPKVVRL